MNTNCNYKIHVEDIYSLVSKAIQNKYVIFKIRSEIENDKRLFECPFPNCIEIVKVINIKDGENENSEDEDEEEENSNDEEYDEYGNMYLRFSNNNNNKRSNKYLFTDSDLECAKHHRFCGRCKKNVHIPCSCEDLDNWLLLLSQNKIITRDPDAITYNWISENTKFCPKCHIRIEKNKGCNHMICQHCHFQFCWLCLCDWSIHGEETGGFFHCNKIAEQIQANRKIQAEKNEAKFQFCTSKYVLVKDRIEIIKFEKQVFIYIYIIICIDTIMCFIIKI